MVYFITTLNASITQKKRAVFYKKRVEDVIKTFNSLVERQQDGEVSAI